MGQDNFFQLSYHELLIPTLEVTRLTMPVRVSKFTGGLFCLLLFSAYTVDS